MPWPAGAGYDAEAAQVHRGADRVEHERADRLVVEHGQQPAVLLQQLGERLGGLGQRGRRRVERRADLEGGPDHRQQLDGRLRPDASYVDAHRLSTRSAAAAISWSSAALTWSCRSMITMWPAPSHSTRTEPGSFECSLRLWPIEVSLSSVPQMIVVGTACSALDGVELVELAEVREELRDHLERRRRRASRRRTRRSSPGTSSPKANRSVATVATDLPTRRRPSTWRWPRASVATSLRRQLAADGPGQQRQHDAVRVEAAGGRRDQADADDPVAEQLGVLLGQGDDRHAAHGVADQHDRARRGRPRRGSAAGRGRAGRRWRCPRWTGRSGRASAGRSRRPAPARGSRRAGSASSRG